MHATSSSPELVAVLPIFFLHVCFSLVKKKKKTGSTVVVICESIVVIVVVVVYTHLI